METTELRHAFAWTCDSCGRDNFGDVAVIESPTDEFENREIHTTPTTVKCLYCDAVYDATMIDDED